MKKHLIQSAKILALALLLGTGVGFLQAQTTGWQAPPCATPANCNAPAPLNTSSIAQAKTGSLTVGTLGASPSNYIASFGFLSIFGKAYVYGDTQIGETATANIPGNLKVVNGSATISNDVTINSKNGSGNSYACFDSSGKFFRSNDPCVAAVPPTGGSVVFSTPTATAQSHIFTTADFDGRTSVDATVRVYGAGGGGGGGGGISSPCCYGGAGGGGGGGYSTGVHTLTVGVTYNYFVGLGGARGDGAPSTGSTVNGTDGGDGEQSYFAQGGSNFEQAGGGNGGIGGKGNTSGSGFGGTGGAGDTYNGGVGGFPQNTSGCSPSFMCNGGGGAPKTYSAGGNGNINASWLGGIYCLSSGSSSCNASGHDATNVDSSLNGPGAGGSGGGGDYYYQTSPDSDGGKGADGYIQITW